MKFKRLFTAACGAAVLVSSVFGAGCDNRTYGVYTNIPQGAYEITDGSFRLGGEIGGYISDAPEQSEEVTETLSYTGKGIGFSSMYTEAQLVIYDDFNADGAMDKFNAFAKEVGQTLDKISKAVSSTVTDSDMYNFNNADAGATVQISETVFNILQQAKSLYEFTDGYYNPALYYNIQAYGFSGAESYPETADELPDNGIIAKYTDLATHFGEIVLSNEDGYSVTKPEYTVEVAGETLSLKIDLGGIAKGYAVDRVEELFDEYGYEYGYFNFGASSMLVKKFPESGNFNIEFVNPRSIKRDGYFKIEASDEKLSTSGDNEQYYTIDGVRYCHIIDASTGKPVQTGIMSVTVIGGGAAEDDAITTAIMAMGTEKAVKFIEEKLTDRKVVFTVENYVA